MAKLLEGGSTGGPPFFAELNIVGPPAQHLPNIEGVEGAQGTQFHELPL